MRKTAEPSLGRLIVLIACSVVVVAGMKAAAALVVPFFCAVFVAVLSLPLLRWLGRAGVPVSVALVAVLLCMVLLAITILIVIGSSLAGFENEFGTYSDSLRALYARTKSWMSGFIEVSDGMDSAIDPQALLAYIGQAASQLGTLLSNVFVILLLVAFLLAEAGSLESKLREVSNDPEAATARIEAIRHGINQYFSIKIAVSLVTGALVYILLWTIGVDHPSLWSFIAFLLNFVPNIGSFLAAIPAILLALVQPELGTWSACLVGAGFLLINIVIGSVLEPKIMGKGLNLSNLAVLLSLLFWGWVLGPVGMLLSVPLTVAAKIILEVFPEGRPIARLLGSGNQPQDGIA